MLGRAARIWLSCLLLAAPATGQNGTETPGDGQPRPAAEATAPLSAAERIARLTRAIDEGERQIAELKAVLEDPKGEFALAEAEFAQIDAALDEKRREQQRLRDAGESERAEALQAEIDTLTQRRQLARERFDLAIQDRKARLEQLAALEVKLRQDRDALAALRSPATQPAATPQEPRPEPAPPPGPPPAAPPNEAQPPPAPDAHHPPAATAPPAGVGVEPPARPVDQKVVEAKVEAESKAASAQEAEQEARSIAGRIESLLRTIELERKLLATARRQRENAQETERTLSDQAGQRLAEGASQAELRELWAKVSDARRRSQAAQAEVTQRVDRLDALQADLRTLQSDQIASLQEAERRRQEAEAARRRVEFLESPLAPRNLLRWVVERGPRVLGIVLAAFVLLWLSRAAEARITALLAKRGERGSAEHRENRARTLVSVFHSTATAVIVAGGSLMVLSEVGVNIAPLLGGAAVAGLAVAFGAQNLIRDYFYGFMILLENQFTVNDVVRIGTVSGLVERITLRTTTLRDIEGTAHIIPNGEITRVSNMTHGWSRAHFEIPVAYKENVDEVMRVLMQLADSLRQDPAWRIHLLEPPEMLGVDAFGDSGVVIRFFIKTRPLQQWKVRRELLRRIKNRFDQLGIEIPFPHRTVYHRFEDPRPAGESEPEQPDS